MHAKYTSWQSLGQIEKHEMVFHIIFVAVFGNKT